MNIYGIRLPIKALLQLVYAGAVLSMLFWLLVRQDALATLPGLLLSPWAWVVVTGWMAGVTLMGLLWKALLAEVFSIEVRIMRALCVQYLSWPGRYLPMRIGLFLGKVGLLKLDSVRATPVVQSVFLEQILFLLSGVVLALALCAARQLSVEAGSDNAPVFVAIALLLTVVGCALAVRALNLFAPLIRRWTPIAEVGPLPRLRLSAGYVGLHLLLGATHWPLMLAWFPDMAASIGLLWLVIFVAAAHVLGALAWLVPSGLGVREGVLVYLLHSAGASLEDAIVLVAAYRLLSIFADGLTFLLGLVLKRADPGQSVSV